MLVDSHCHLNLLDFNKLNKTLDQVINDAIDADVGHFLCVCVELEDYPKLCEIAKHYPNVSISVGVHPCTDPLLTITQTQLTTLAQNHLACIAIGETGLDYCRTHDKQVQQLRFRHHIRAAITTKKPLIIHTRNAQADTIAVMNDENAAAIGGVMHCFSESYEMAKQAMAMNFYISVSGIVTFKNAQALQEIVKKLPLDALLIETDSPYLAPEPYRGLQNQPAYVKAVAQKISELKNISYQEVMLQTTKNFKQCFNLTNLSVC